MPLDPLPHEVATPTREELTRRIKYREHLVQGFWVRWSKEYLRDLNRQYMKTYKKQPVKVGEVVLVMDENLPRHEWKLARIIEAVPGRDGIVRTVRLRMDGKETRRGIQKICSLEIPPVPLDSTKPAT